MTIFKRPMVATRETDIATIVRGASSAVCAAVGAARRGPVNKRVLATTTKEMIDLFGNPDISYGYGVYNALCALEDTNALYYTRVTNGAKYSGIVVNKSGSINAFNYLKTPISDFDPEAVPSLSIAVVDEQIGIGDGVATNFIYTLLARPVTAINNIKVNNIAITNLVVDLNAGTVVGTGLTGTINKTTGVLSLTFTTPVVDTRRITISYDGTSTEACFILYADNPGVWGNNLKISTESIDSTDNTFDLAIYETVDGIDILRSRLTVSRVEQKDGYGKQLYIEEVYNDNNPYVRIVDLPQVPATTLPALITLQPLSGGTDGSAVTSADIINGWTLYENRADIDVRILLNCGYVSETDFTVQSKMLSLAETRGDCIALLDAPYSELSMSPTTDLTDWRRNIQNFNSSYCALYGPWTKVYDRFNDKHNLPIPPSGFVGAVFARTFNISDWLPPAGYNRGRVKSGQLPFEELTHKYSEGQQDLLYDNNINYIISNPGLSTVVWGQKTMQTKASPLDRINVRMLLIVTSVAAKEFLKFKLFELNNRITRAQIEEELTRYFKTVKARNGVYDFQVVCNETNNPPEIIDLNQLNVDVYLQPQKSAEFIQYQSIITSTGVDFNTLINGQLIQ